MANLPNTNDSRKLSEKPLSREVSLSQSIEGKQYLSAYVARSMESVKTYGKDPENIKSIVSHLADTLAEYPAGKVVNALKKHSKISDELPTPSDIVALIDGKPITESRYVQIGKKPAENRTPQDWKDMRKYEAQFRGMDLADDKKLDTVYRENVELRKEIMRLKDENRKLWCRIHAEPSTTKTPYQRYSEDEMVNRTVAQMETDKAPKEHIQEFLRGYGLEYTPQH